MKRYSNRRGWRSKSALSLVSGALLVAAGAFAATATATPGSGGSTSGTTAGSTTVGGHGPRSAEDSGELMESINAFNEARTAPSGVVTPGAYNAAWQHVLGMPVNQASYTATTTQT